uniref:hypothetical protein n=1 Tax=Clostridium sp. 12(A) TaxID=1163671 RepID=UPI0004652C4C|nr:hypothetical protein [Clostridium sp. 12(A)]
MTGTNTYTNRNHRTYGGVINVESFNTEYRGFSTMSDIAGRIISDMKFDIQCIKNYENRDRLKNGGEINA